MEKFDDIALAWQSMEMITDKATSLSDETDNPKNQTIMKSILDFEKYEKQEKDKQIILGFTAIFTLAAVGAMNVFLNNIQLDAENYLGFGLLAFALGYAIITNRTDDFPDVRELPMLDYLKSFRENVIHRRKRHIRNSIIAYLLFIPAYPLMLRNLEMGPEWIWYVYVVVVSIGTFVWWHRKYKAKWQPLLAEIDDRLKQMDH